MKIYFDKLYKDDRKSELCGLCIPFSKGALKESDVSTIRVLDVDRSLKTQAQITSKWDDGSIRYIYLRFLADLPGNEGKELLLTYKGDAEYDESPETGSSPQSTSCDSNLQNGESCQQDSIHIEQTADTITVSNGPLKFTLRNSTNTLFDSFAAMEKNYDSSQFVGPYVTIAGEKFDTAFDEWKVVQKGDIFTVLRGNGRCIPRSTELSGEGIKFEMRLSVTLEKPWIDVGYRFINCTDGDVMPDDIVFAIKSGPDAELDLSSPVATDMIVDSTGCGDTKKTSEDGDIITTTGTKDLPLYDFSTADIQSGQDTNNTDIRTIAAKSNYRTDFKISRTGKTLENIILAEILEKTANEHFAEVFYGTFFADYTDAKRNLGVCATVFQAFQNYPKAVKSDENGVVIYLIPDQNINREKTMAQPVVFTSGMAREQRFLLHFHEASEPIYELDNRSIIYQMPDEPWIDPMEFAKAGVMPDIFLNIEDQIDDVELCLIEKADAHARCYGMLNFGDGPDPGYTAQGRGAGNLVWTNNEYDFPHAMYMMYARSGIRRFLDYANIAAQHWMDVDVCHYSSDPLRMGGQWEHTRRHTGGSEEGRGCKGEMVCSHEWVEGLLDLYHFTGDERALETALGIGENVRRLLETPMYQVPGESSARETGWALRTLTALFLETHDTKWTEKCEWILSQFKAWNDRYGNWLSPYTDNTAIRVGFMISVAVGSLMRYYRAFPSDELRSLMLGAIDDLTENFMTGQGIFVYKELPSLSRNGTNTLLLEAMAIGYELTGDDKYLRFGKKTFDRSIVGTGPSLGNKRIVEDAVIAGTGAPKNFAQSFLPITYFYVKLVESNLLL